jgi:hypothetical protein
MQKTIPNALKSEAAELDAVFQNGFFPILEHLCYLQAV